MTGESHTSSSIERIWTQVTSGESGARVYRSPDGGRHAKLVAPEQMADLAGERDRVEWLHTTGVPGPAVLDWHTDEAGACLVTSTVEGVPADEVSAGLLRRAWPSITEATRALHSLPPETCPFTRTLSEMWAMAADVVARGAVNPDFLPVEQQQTPPRELLARLATQLDVRLAQEPHDTVVCHGDLCLPNIILNPDTLTVSGFIDLGRLGRADRHADLALLLTTAGEPWPTPTLDPDRLRFYLHLDPLTWLAVRSPDDA